MDIRITAHIVNMESFARTFLMECHNAAMQDGYLDKSEIKQIRKIEKATEKYLKELSKCK